MKSKAELIEWLDEKEDDCYHPLVIDGSLKDIIAIKSIRKIVEEYFEMKAGGKYGGEK
jgi:hypothetical protein